MSERFLGELGQQQPPFSAQIFSALTSDYAINLKIEAAKRGSHYKRVIPLRDNVGRIGILDCTFSPNTNTANIGFFLYDPRNPGEARSTVFQSRGANSWPFPAGYGSLYEGLEPGPLDKAVSADFPPSILHLSVDGVTIVNQENLPRAWIREMDDFFKAYSLDAELLQRILNSAHGPATRLLSGLEVAEYAEEINGRISRVIANIPAIITRSARAS